MVTPAVTSKEIKEILKRTGNRSAPGRDGINYKSLKLFNKAAPEILAGLYSMCLQYRLFPAEWKSGTVIWIPKNGKELNSHSSYRPITLLSTLGKTRWSES